MYLDKNEQHKDGDELQTFSDSYTNFVTKLPLTKPASKKTSNPDKPTNIQRDIEPQTNHPFTKSYEDDTNITYVDEDSADDEPKLDYQPLESEKPTRLINRDHRLGAITKNTEKPHGKSEYNEEVKLLKKMLPLLAKYKVLQLDKNDKTNDVQSETQLSSGSGRKIEPNITHGTLVGDQKTNSIHEDTETKHKQQDFPVSFSKVKETQKDGFQNSRDPGKIKKQNNVGNMEITNFNHANDILHTRNEKVMALSKQSKLTTSSENINIQKIPHGGKNISVLSTAILSNQTALDLATPEQSKIAFGNNMENTNTKLTFRKQHFITPN